MRIWGQSIDPHAAWLVDRGMRTLALRMARHNANGLAVARVGVEHARGIATVHYPGLPSHPDHALAKRSLDGFGGMVGLELEGGATAAERMLKRLKLVTHAPSLAGVESLVSEPRLTSHKGISPEDARRARDSRWFPPPELRHRGRGGHHRATWQEAWARWPGFAIFRRVIRLSHVYKAYPNGALALKDVSFRVGKGEFVFLTGHSGAGKSTIMKLLFAEQRPTQRRRPRVGLRRHRAPARRDPQAPPAARRRVPGLPPARGPDGGGERRVRARGDGRARRHDRRAGHAGPHAGGARGQEPRLPARALRRRAAARGDRPRAGERPGDPRWPTSPPAISTSAPPAASSSCSATSTPAAPWS